MKPVYAVLVGVTGIATVGYLYKRQIDAIKNSALQRLKNVKVSCIYENITDAYETGRTTEQTANILNEIKTDFIFRGFWNWGTIPNTCEQLSNPDIVNRCNLLLHSYQLLGDTISKIKNVNPQVLIVGSIPAQRIPADYIYNPKTDRIFRYPSTWDLALDPQKWNIPVSKTEFQCEFAKWLKWYPQSSDCSLYDPATVGSYFPDITNPDYQSYMVSVAERQIDDGMEAIWIDALYIQAGLLHQVTNNPNHPAVMESCIAASGIVDKIHSYGMSKGKYILVGSWGMFCPYIKPAFDFITVSPSNEEVQTMIMNEAKWDTEISELKNSFGDIPIFAFIDFGPTINSPLGIFSQVLTKEQQSQFITIADNFFTGKGVKFAYPVHGGWMGDDATVLAFGTSKKYDSLAPEFDTYTTIRQLAQAKSGI